MDKNEEYKLLAELERQTTNSRNSTFTAILSISFVVPGLALQSKAGNVMIFGDEIELSCIVFLLGYLFYLFAVFHYSWHHRYSHIYRKRLKELESSLGINIYRLRRRPKLGSLKFHYEWFLLIIAVVYGCITVSFVGIKLFLGGITSAVLFYRLYSP